MELVGRGEKVAYNYLTEWFPPPRNEVKTQVPLYKMLSEKYRNDLSERQQKESIDLVVLRKHEKPICVRIQDRHHDTVKFGHIDKNQRMLLEWSRCIVIDIPEYECPELFKDNLTVNAREELKKYIKPYL